MTLDKYEADVMVALSALSHCDCLRVLANVTKIVTDYIDESTVIGLTDDDSGIVADQVVS